MIMPPRSLQFASFTLDVDRLCLFGPCGRAQLRPKSFEVLRYLIHHTGRVVGKEELIKAVWPNVTVTDESLTRCISEVRHVLGDEGQRIIKTVPKRGYLFDVPISTVDAAPPPPLAGKIAPSDKYLCEPEPETVGHDVLVGKRKQVTVLHADLKPWLVAQRDPEEALKIFEAVLPLMTQAVANHEGTVNVVTGDGIMALFGAPLAQEDHAIRACHAALQIQDAVKRYARDLQHAGEVPILVRVGLNSGEVVIRSIGNGARTECHAMGQAIHLADRLGEIAAPGTSLIGAETLRLAEGHVRVKALERANLIGQRDPVYELVGAEPTQTRFRVLAARGLTGFVGREVEMEQLERVRARAEQQHGQLVAIIGESGLGKSRLVHEFIHLYGTPWLVLEAASVSYRRAASYQPVIDLLWSYFKIQATDDVREMRNKVAGCLLDLDRELARDLSPLLALLDIPVEEPSWQSLEPFQRRQRTLDALKRLILRECEQQPVVLAFEDLHWIDSETQAFLDTLIDSLASARLLLVLTYRPEYEHRWGGKSYYTQLRLDALSSGAVEEFLRNSLGNDISLIRLKEQLPRDGNPLFLEESIRALVETSVLEGKRGAYRLVGPVPELRIPPTVQSILAARIDRLPSRDRWLLHAASVVGKDVPHAILQSLAGLPEDELRRGLAELREAEFLYESRLLPDVEYTFKHALTHDVAYESLLGEERSALHRQIVEVIERLYPDRLIEHVEQLAHHALRGELRDKAVHYLRQAGVKAAARSALLDARTWFEQAVDVLSVLPESQSTLEQAVDIRFELRAVLNQLGQPRRVLERLLEAEALAERLNDHRRRSQARILAMNVRSMLGELDEVCATGARELPMAQQLSEFHQTVLVTTLEMAHYFHSDYLRVVELAAGLEAALPSADDIGTWYRTGPNLHTWVIMSLAELGRFSEAAMHETEAIRFAGSTDHAFTIGLIHRAAGTLHLLKGEWARARSLIEHWIEVARAGNVVLQFPTAIASFAWVMAQIGGAREALDAVREGERLIERQATSGVVVNGGSVYHALGRASLMLGRLDEARGLADRAVECSLTQLGFAAHALHLLGDIATHSDRFDADTGEAHYREALALAEPRGMRPLVAHCHRGLGDLYRHIGAGRKAEKHLAIATSMYREMDMRFWLDKIPKEIKIL
jgi:DNA-binding winged helix-turn-helix (wHTH) protein/tetratricopeptide (TPR) repeat protein